MTAPHKTVLFVSDVHTPYEDQHACQLIRKAAAEIKPDTIIFGGDIIDFESVSRWLKLKPIRDDQAIDDIGYARRWLEEWRDCHPKAHMYFIEGNHEFRFIKYFREHAPQLAGLIRPLREALGIGRMRISYRENQGTLKIGRLWYAHGDNWPMGYGAVNPAKCVFDRTRESIVFGHVHRFSMYRHRAMSGKEVGAWSNGCLAGDLDYMPHNNWNRGALTINYSRSGYFRVSPLEVIAGRLMYPTAWREAQI